MKTKAEKYLNDNNIETVVIPTGDKIHSIQIHKDGKQISIEQVMADFANSLTQAEPSDDIQKCLSIIGKHIKGDNKHKSLIGKVLRAVNHNTVPRTLLKFQRELADDIKSLTPTFTQAEPLSDGKIKDAAYKYVDSFTDHHKPTELQKINTIEDFTSGVKWYRDNHPHVQPQVSDDNIKLLKEIYGYYEDNRHIPIPLGKKIRGLIEQYRSPLQTEQPLTPITDKEIKTLMGLCDTNADKHYTKPYEELTSEGQHEYEGLMWGWQDCIKYLNERGWLHTKMADTPPLTHERVIRDMGLNRIEGLIESIEEGIDIDMALQELKGIKNQIAKELTTDNISELDKWKTRGESDV